MTLMQEFGRAQNAISVAARSITASDLWGK